MATRSGRPRAAPRPWMEGNSGRQDDAAQDDATGATNDAPNLRFMVLARGTRARY